MKSSDTVNRIIAIQSELPCLQQELSTLTAKLQQQCTHPYGIGWTTKSTGLVTSRGAVGCPACGLVARVTGYHSPIIATPFDEKPMHWISNAEWNLLFNNVTLSERIQRLEAMNLARPPIVE